MKKRIFSIFLTLALLCSMLPQFSLPVNAENAEDDVEGHDSACSCSECCCESECDDSAKCFEDYIQGQLKCEAMSDNCLSNTPLINTATSSSDITAQLTTLKNTYKAGSYWNHKSGSSYDGYSVSNTPCGTNNYECNQLYGGSQCWAFARHLAKILFGSYPPEASAFSDGYTTNTGWKLIRNPSNVTLEPGDYIRADGHSAIVWYLDGNKVYVAQCWGGSGCKLDWGAFWGSSKCTTVSDIVSTNFVGVWKHPGTSASYYLDVNGRLLSGYNDGEYQDKSNIADWGTCDVYINGKLDADDVTDYYKQWPTGTQFEIKDVKSSGLRDFRKSKSVVSGTIGNSSVDARLVFENIHLKCDLDSINLKVGEEVSVLVQTVYQLDFVDKISATIYDKSIATLSPQEPSYDVFYAYKDVKGIKEGNTTLAVTITKGTASETITIPIHVSGNTFDRYLTVSDWNIELIGSAGDRSFPKTITISCPGNYPSRYYLSYEKGEYLFDAWWADEWNGNSLDLTLCAKTHTETGSTWLKIGLYDSSNNQLVDSVTLSVTVTDPYNHYFNGIYLLCRNENGYYSDMGLCNYYGNVEQRSDYGGDTEFARSLWIFERQQDKTFVIRNLYDNSYLVPGGTYDASGCNVYTTYEYPSEINHRWVVKKHPEGGWYLCLATFNGMVLDIDDASMDVGANAQLWWENGTNAQCWKFDNWSDLICAPRESFTPSTPSIWSEYDAASDSYYLKWTQSPVITEEGALDSRAYELVIIDETSNEFCYFAVTTDREYKIRNTQPGHRYKAFITAVNTEFNYNIVPYTCSDMNSCELAVPAEKVNPFVDVHETDFFFNPVLWAVESGITAGTDETHFSPNNTVMRADAMVFFWAANERPAFSSTDKTFRDVKKKHWAYDAVMWAVENGITGGTDAAGQYFSPQKTCSRSEILQFLYAAMGKPVYHIDNPYSDVKPKHWYYDGAIWAYENGLEKGEDGKFQAKTPCTRGYVVTYLYRFITGQELAE